MVVRPIDANALQERLYRLGLWNDSKAAFYELIESMPTITTPNEATYPCDLCVYNPPSSLDGKPCTYCPATGRPPEGEI